MAIETMRARCDSAYSRDYGDTALAHILCRLTTRLRRPGMRCDFGNKVV